MKVGHYRHVNFFYFLMEYSLWPMTSSEQSLKSEKVFIRYRKQLVIIFIFFGLVGFFTGEKKEVTKVESGTTRCLIRQSYNSGIPRLAGYYIPIETCESEYGKLQNPEKFLKKLKEGIAVQKRDFGAEAVSRVIRFFGFGISAALVAAVVLALRARSFKEKVTKVKKEFLVKLVSAKSKSQSEKVSLLNRFRKQGDNNSRNLQRQANSYANATSVLAVFLFVLAVIGSVIIALSPEEQCGSGFSSDYCEKDWSSSIVKALVGFFLSSLVMLSVLTVATYIQWRTSRPETNSN